MFERKIEKLGRQTYVTTWRPRLFRYYQAASVRYEEGLQRVLDTAQEVGYEDWVGWLLEPAVEDGGLWLYADSQAFLT